MRKTVIFTVLFLLLLPAIALADEDEFGSSFGIQSRQAAVVGKVIGESDVTGYYIVYGRLSLVTSQGYRVYETGKFFYVSPTTKDSKEFIKQRVGQGIKAFGQLELVRSSVNSEVLYTNQIIPYKPEDDYGVMEPAYGAAGPHEWIGFGVAQDQYRVSGIKVEKSTDVINTLAGFTELLLQGGRTILTDNRSGEAVFYEPKTKKVFEIKDIVSALTGTKTEFTPNKKDFLAPIRNFWQKYIKQNWLMERSKQAYAEMSRALKGYVFILGQLGKANNLMESVPVMRPDIDKFMTYIESRSGQGFSKWASPAVFYGRISGTPDRYTYLLITPKEVIPENPWEEIEYINPTFTGTYYAEDNPNLLVEHIAEIKNNNIPQVNSDDPSEHYRDIEKWPIGYQGPGSLYRGFIAEQYAHYAGQNIWMTGTRVLVYKIVSCNKDGCSVSYEHVEYGNMQEGTFGSGDNTTTVTLVGHYIKPEHIITKPQYNLLLDLIKELIFKGGV